MNIIGADFLRSTLESDGYLIKLVLNDSTAYFFPSRTEHREATQPCLCYMDDSQGNALAATVKPRHIDIRYHRAFSDKHVAALAQKLITHPDASGLVGFTVTYQGRTVIS